MGLSDDINRINAEINKLRKELGAGPLKLFKQEDLKEAQYTLSGLRAEIREMGSDLDYIAKSYKDSVNELSRQNEYLKDARKSLSSISDIARKITDYRRGESSSSEKQLKNLQSQARVKFESLKNDLKSGQLTKEQAKEVRYALDQQEVFNESIETTIKHQKQVNKEIGLVGQGIGGIGKALSKLGFGDLSQPLQDAIDKTKSARLQIKLNNDEYSKLSEKRKKLGKHDLEGKKALLNQMSSLKSQNKELSTQTSKYKNIGGALKDQLTKFNLIDFSIMGMINALLETDKAIGKMAKGMDMTYSQAANARKELTSIASLSGDAALNTKRLEETLHHVNSALGTNGKLSEEDLKTFTKLREQAGMTNETLLAMNKYSMVMGGSLEENVVSFRAQAKSLAYSKGVALNVKDLMADMAKVSNRTKISIEGGADGLAKSAVSAKLMGADLEKVAGIADKLLDFESSIESELSAELLTGKALNLEKARTAALNNDMATVAEEITKQAGSAAEFGKMNRIQQEAIAASMGMSADGMADMLVEQEALKSIGQSLNEEEQRAFDLAKEKYGVEEAARRLKSDAQGEGLQGLLDQQDTQESFNQSIEKMKEIFISVANALTPIFDMLRGVFDIIGPIVGLVMDWGKYLLPIIAGMKTLHLVGTAIKVIKEKGLAITLREAAAKTALMIKEKASLGYSIGEAAMGAIKSLSGIPIIGWALGLAAAATVATLGYSYMKDGVIGPGGETVVSGPKGSIQLDKQDSMVVGTDLGGKKKPSSSGGGGATVNMEPTNALLRQLISAVNAGGIVTLDGALVGEALKLGAHKTQ